MAAVCPPEHRFRLAAQMGLAGSLGERQLVAPNAHGDGRTGDVLHRATALVGTRLKQREESAARAVKSRNAAGGRAERQEDPLDKDHQAEGQAGE
jgi:hypothetical protein